LEDAIFAILQVVLEIAEIVLFGEKEGGLK